MKEWKRERGIQKMGNDRKRKPYRKIRKKEEELRTKGHRREEGKRVK